jgi:hypothetical protein
MVAGRLGPRCRHPCRAHVEIVGSPQKSAGRAGPSLAHGAKKGWGRGGGPWSCGIGGGTHRPRLVSMGGESPPHARPLHEEVRLEGLAARRGGEPRLRDGVRVRAGGSRRRGEGGEEEAILTPGVAPQPAIQQLRARMCARVCTCAWPVRAREGRGGGSREEEKGWDGRSGGGGRVGRTRVSRGSAEARAAPAPRVWAPALSVSLCSEIGDGAGPPRACWNVYGCRGSRAPSRGGIRCKVLRRARWSSRVAATGATLLAARTAS